MVTALAHLVFIVNIENPFFTAPKYSTLRNKRSTLYGAAASMSSQDSRICGSVGLHGGMTSLLGCAWWLYGVVGGAYKARQPKVHLIAHLFIFKYSYDCITKAIESLAEKEESCLCQDYSQL